MGSGVRAPVIQSSLGAAAYSLIFLLLAIAPGSAQSPPPLPGFVPPFEITRIVRTAGFDPMARPLREGTTYVVRATDFRGILMRVVVDRAAAPSARSTGSYPIKGCTARLVCCRLFPGYHSRIAGRLQPTPRPNSRCRT